MSIDTIYIEMAALLEKVEEEGEEKWKQMKVK